MNKGEIYEKIAQRYLAVKGYSIIKTNYACRFGEIDIIAKDKDYICFIEVKARSADYIVSAIEAVDKRKQEKIIKTAQFYIGENNQRKFRFDVLGIVYGEQWLEYNLYKNAFSMDN